VGINETAQAGRLQHLLNISAVGLAVLYALGLWQSLVTRNWLVAVIESALLLLVITATLSRNGDGRLRAVSLLVSLYCAGVLAIVLTPFSGLSQIILLTSVLFAVVLFGYPVGNFLAILAGISVAAGGYGLMMGYLPLNGTAAADYRSILFWMAAGFFCVLGGLVLARAQSGIQRSWETSLTQLQQAFLGVEVERDALRESSADLERRLVQLKAVAEISRISNSVDDPADLMDQVVSLIQEHFNLYYAGIFLLDENLENAVLKAGSGEAGQQMVGDQHQLPVGGASMVGWAVAHGKARIALDTGAEDIRFENPLLPRTRSELALPLRSGKKVIGALTIQSDTPNAFDENDLTVLQGLADAITVALENARRFQEVQSYLKEIESLNRQYLISAWSGHLEAGQPLEYTYLDGSTTPPGKSGEIHHSDLVIRDQVIGSLAVESRESGWNDEDIGLIEAVAAQASQALENARLLRETQNKAYQEELVSDFSSSIRETFNLDAILRTAVRELGDRLDLTEVEAHIGWSEDEAVGEE
jgi:GAF domain-containing protein